MEKLTYKDVIEDTLKHFSEYNRCKNKGNGLCSYYNEEGEMCALGRYLKDPKSIEKISGDLTSVLEYIEGENISEGKRIIHYQDILSDLLKDEVKHLNIVSFWWDLQSFHDTDDYWDEGKLTTHGLKVYNMLLKEWE